MNTQASEIMSSELLTVKATTTIEEALKLMINSRITGMPVVDAEGKMIGILSEYDILEQIAKFKTLKAEIFQKPIAFSNRTLTIRDNTPLSEVITNFIETKVRRLPVVDASDRLIGIITRRDLMRVFYYRSKLT